MPVSDNDSDMFGGVQDDDSHTPETHDTKSAAVSASKNVVKKKPKKLNNRVTIITIIIVVRTVFGLGRAAAVSPRALKIDVEKYDVIACGVRGGEELRGALPVHGFRVCANTIIL